MPAFIKNLLRDPKFDACAIVVLWVVYIIGKNFQLSPVEFHLIPLSQPLSVPVSEIVIGSMAFGCLATVAVQFFWKRRRSSKPSAESVTASAASTKTVA